MVVKKEKSFWNFPKRKKKRKRNNNNNNRGTEENRDLQNEYRTSEIQVNTDDDDVLTI